MTNIYINCNKNAPIKTNHDCILLYSLQVILAHDALTLEDIEVHSGYTILPDIFVDRSEKFIYAASPYKIVKISSSHCHDYRTCSQCIQARDPYCGWCSLQNRCTIKSDCLSKSFRDRIKSGFWESIDNHKCSGRHLTASSKHHESLSLDSRPNSSFCISKLPKLAKSSNYQCIFGNGPPVDGQVKGDYLICPLLRLNEFPEIRAGRSHVKLDLAIRSQETMSEFLNQECSYFNCNVHSTCRQCSSTEWNCVWCLNSNICSSSEASCPNNSERSINLPKSTSNIITDPGECPSLHHELLIPSDVSTKLQLKVKTLPQTIDGIQCLLIVEETEFSVIAQTTDSETIECGEIVYHYKAEHATLPASLFIVQDHDGSIIDRINVTMYKCRLLASKTGRADCSNCLNLKEPYKCNWCDNSCRHENSCSTNELVESCSSSKIHYVHPLSGPIQGGTWLTIRGDNLGNTWNDSYGEVLIGDIPCDILNHDSVRIVCQTRQVKRPFSGDIIVKQKDGQTIAKQKYHYSIIELSNVHPKFGPQSGGTKLIISGTNLNIGSSVQIFLDQIQCSLDSALTTKTQLVCRTSPASRGSYQVKKLLLKVDNAEVTLDDPFYYTENPKIHRISPLKSYKSGGRLINVYGSNLTVVQQPKIAVLRRDGSIINDTICEVLMETRMLCLSPAINLDNHDNKVQFQASSYSSELYNLNSVGQESGEIVFKIGFILDGVNTIESVSSPMNHHHHHKDRLIYVPDPKLFLFSGNDAIKFHDGQKLMIEGKNLNSAANEDEFNVTVGSVPCNLLELTASRLICAPPDFEPPSTDEHGQNSQNGLPKVVVRVGRNLRYEIGYLRYKADDASILVENVIKVLLIALTVALTIILMPLMYLKHKNFRAEQEYKRIRLQMNSIEDSVRHQCKQAFAELQTNMLDITSELAVTGVPVLSHRVYVTKVFFPGTHDHPLIQEPLLRVNGTFSNYELAMGHFEQLLNNKTFLIAFINTLELQKNFTVRDR